MGISQQSQIERAKQDGRWDAAYAPASAAEVPAILQASLDQNPQAKIAFEALTKSQRYSLFFRLNTAKKIETQERYIREILLKLQPGD